MIIVKEPYSQLKVTIKGNKYFDASRDSGFEVDFKIEANEIKTLIVNNRELQSEEWEYDDGVFRISLTNWV